MCTRATTSLTAIRNRLAPTVDGGRYCSNTVQRWTTFHPHFVHLVSASPLFHALFKNELDIIEWFFEEAIVNPEKFCKFLFESMEDRGMYIPTLNGQMAVVLLSVYLCIGFPIWFYQKMWRTYYKLVLPNVISLKEKYEAGGSSVDQLLMDVLCVLVASLLVIDSLLLIWRLLTHSLPRDKNFSSPFPFVQFTFGTPIRAMLFVLHGFGEVEYFVYICICRLRPRPSPLHHSSLNLIIGFQSNITLDV